MLKSLSAAIIRVGNFSIGMIIRVVTHQADLGLSGSAPLDRAQALQIIKIHRNDVIESIEIFRANLAGKTVQLVPATLGG